MKGIAYFPGCSLKETAKDFEISAIAVMDALGIPLIELKRWNCCGTVFSLTSDDLMHHIASVRNLIRAQEMESPEVVVLCSMCFNTLKRVSLRVNRHEESLTKINAFMNKELDYAGEVEVKHLLEILRDRIGWEQVSEKVIHPLYGVSIAAYYGCTLVRPSEVGIDDTETPTVLQEMIESLGATAVSFPFQTECCGSYQIVDRRDLVINRSYRILSSAQRAGAQVLITACPLCQYNLDEAQTELAERLPDYTSIPVLYFTQAIALALGVEAGTIPDLLPESLVGQEIPKKGETTR